MIGGTNTRRFHFSEENPYRDQVGEVSCNKPRARGQLAAVFNLKRCTQNDDIPRILKIFMLNECGFSLLPTGSLD